MNIGLIILIAVLAFYYLDKKISRFEDQRGIGYPFSCRISLVAGLISNKYFVKLAGMTKDIADYKSWSLKDKSKFQSTVKKLLGEFNYVSLSYLPSDSSWFVGFHDKYGKWYSNMVADESSIFGISFESGKRVSISDTQLSVNIHVRNIKSGKNYIPVLTGYATYYLEESSEPEYIHLFDFPFANMELINNFSFQIEADDNSYIGPSLEFVQQTVSLGTKYKCNGVEIIR